jgi:hypothetical protein
MVPYLAASTEIIWFSEVLKFLAEKKSFQRRKFCEGKYRNFRIILIVEMINPELIT